MKKISVLPLLIFGCLVVATESSTASVSTNAIYLLPPPAAPFGSDIALGNPGGVSWFNAAPPSFSLLSPATITFGGQSLSYEQNWYAASYGEAFTADTKDSFVPLLVGQPIEVGYADSFYLALNTDNKSQTLEDFGWVLLQWDEFGQLQLADSAVADDEAGIIVGTLEVIPEPSTYALLLLSGAASLWALRRRKS